MVEALDSMGHSRSFPCGQYSGGSWLASNLRSAFHTRQLTVWNHYGHPAMRLQRCWHRKDYYPIYYVSAAPRVHRCQRRLKSCWMGWDAMAVNSFEMLGRRSRPRGMTSAGRRPAPTRVAPTQPLSELDAALAFAAAAPPIKGAVVGGGGVELCGGFGEFAEVL